MKKSILFLLVIINSVSFAQTKDDSTFLKQRADEAYDATYGNLDSARMLAQEVIELAKEKGVFVYEMDAFSTYGDTYFYNYEFEKALSIYKEGYDKGVKRKDTVIQAKFSNYMAMVYEQKAEYRNAVKLYSRSLSLFSILEDTLGIPVSYGNLANAYSSLGNLDSAIMCQKKAIAIREKQHTPKIHNNYNNIGVYYHELGRYDLAIEYYLKAAKIRKEQENYVLEANTYDNLSSLFTDLKDHKNSINYAEKALGIYVRENHEDQSEYTLSNLGTEYKRVKKYDLAIKYYDQALLLHQKTKNESSKSIDLHNLGAVYEELGQLKKALNYYYQSLTLKNELEKTGSSIVTITSIGNVLSVLNKDSAEVMLLTGYEMAIDHKMIDKQRESSEALADHYERNGDYKASSDYRKIESQLKDSLYNEDYTSKMNQLFVSFETERTKNDLLGEQLKSQELGQQKAEADLKVSKKSKQIWLLISITIILLLAGAFLFYRSKQKQQSRLSKIRIEEQQKGLAAVIQVQEDERKRIAKDLHDGIVQQLGGLKLGLQKIFTNQETEETNKIVKILDESAEELRELSHKMMPRALGELGLIPALKDMLDNSLGNTNIEFQFEHFGITERFKENLEIAIYRIAQELVNNVIKHSKANKVNVQLFKTGGDVLLIVEDDGKGINSLEQKDGIGLMNINSRLDTINGKVNFEPSHESGTLATVKIPI